MGVPVHWLPTDNPRYEVSSLGQVRRVGRAPGARCGRVLKPELRNGYHCVRLYGGARDVSRQVLVHRLVLRAFVGPPPPRHECNHKNGVKHDNRVENLEWVTKSVNCKHRDSLPGRMANRRGERSGNAKLTVAAVRRIRAARIGNGTTLRTLAERHKVSRQHIWAIRKRKKWAHLSRTG